MRVAPRLTLLLVLVRSGERRGLAAGGSGGVRRRPSRGSAQPQRRAALPEAADGGALPLPHASQSHRVQAGLRGPGSEVRGQGSLPGWLTVSVVFVQVSGSAAAGGDDRIRPLTNHGLHGRPRESIPPGRIHSFSLCAAPC